MFRFASQKTMNEIASDGSIVNVDVSIDTIEDECDPTGTILLDMNSIQEIVGEVKPPTTTAPLEEVSFKADDVKPPTTIAPLEKSSLHTTCSDASINLDTYRATTTTDRNSGIVQGAGDLSFQVSQLENSSVVLGDGTGLDLTLCPDGNDDDGVSEFYDDDSHVPENSSSLDEVKHDMETLITVSQQLLHSSPPPNQGTTTETKIKGSLLVQYKFFVISAIIAGGLARGLTRCLEVYVALSNFFASWAPPMDTILIREDNFNLIVGDFTYQKEDIDPSSSNHSMGLVQVLVFGMMARLALSTKKKGEEKLDTLGSDNVGSFTSEFDTISAEPSLMRSAPVKRQDDKNLPVADTKCDLSKYEQLTVKELRALLRSRQCTYEGCKVHLIQRLVSVYRAELESMTVVQLRRKLKSKQMKQGGLKRELVQRLLEAGL